VNDEDVDLVLGNYTWSVGARALRRVGQDSEGDRTNEIGLTPKIFRLLTCLYEGRDGVVSKEQIIDFVWESKPISQESLSQLINRTRYLLEDKDKRILVNEPGIGYSLVFGEQCEGKQTTEELSTLSGNIPNTTPPKVESTNKPKLMFSAKYIGLMLLAAISIVNVWFSGRALYYNSGFLEVIKANPYPHIAMKDDGKLVVKIDGNECTYDKAQFLLQCQ